MFGMGARVHGEFDMGPWWARVPGVCGMGLRVPGECGMGLRLPGECGMGLRLPGEFGMGARVPGEFGMGAMSWLMSFCVYISKALPFY